LIYGGVGLLLGLLALIRGLFLLSMGSGYGILLVMGALTLILIAVRFFSTPVAVITEHSLTVYQPFIGKKTLDLTLDITYSTTPTSTILYSENGTRITIQHALLSSGGKRALSLFVEHIKLKSA